MKLDAAIALVSQHFARMDKVYRRPVFDEWALVRLEAETDTILHYTGPRPDAIAAELPDDLKYLRAELQRTDHPAGAFEFARTAAGTGVDAFLVLGDGNFLVCNHTTKTMQEVASDPLWTAAQGHFVNLSERFGVDPLEA